MRYWSLKKLKYLIGGELVIIRTHHTPNKLIESGDLLKGGVSDTQIGQWAIALENKRIEQQHLKDPEQRVTRQLIGGVPHLHSSLGTQGGPRTFTALEPGHVKSGNAL